MTTAAISAAWPISDSAGVSPIRCTRLVSWRPMSRNSSELSRKFSASQNVRVRRRLSGP